MGMEDAKQFYHGYRFPPTVCMANYQSRGDYGLKLFSRVPFAGALLGFRVVWWRMVKIFERTV